MYKQWKVDSVPAPLRAQVARYRNWLLEQEKRATNIVERKNFVTEASTAVRGRGQVFQPYAPYRASTSALTVITLKQQGVLIVGGCLLVVSILQWHIQALSWILGALTVWYLAQLCLCVVACIRASGEHRIPVDQQLLPYLHDCPWPDYTILCPLFQEGPVVSQFLRAMLQLEYPTEHLQILLLTEERDPVTRAEIVAMGTLPAHVTLVTVPDGGPRTKPRACNYGLTLATGQYCVIYDGEDIVDPQQLKKAVLTFATYGPDLACVQAQLNFYNTYQNLLTRFFTIEYTLWFDLMLPALQKMKLALPLGGTSNHFVTSVLRGLGGWDAFNVTEDADLGMRLSQHHFTTAMLESTTYEEANADLGNWVRQRSRWIKGYLQTYLVHTRRPFSALSKGRGKTLFSLFALVGGGSLTFFFNPLMWLMLGVYIVFRVHVEGIYHALFPAPVLYSGVLCLIFGNFFYVYSSMVACVRRKQYGLVPWCLLLPVYWLLMSGAACKGVYQLATRPHYWEKTRHGLHLKDRKATANVIAISQQMLQAAASAPTEQAQTVTASKPLSSLTEAVKAISTLPMAAVDKTYREAIKKRSETRTRDVGFYFSILLSVGFSIGTSLYYYLHHGTLLYADAQAHIRLARSFFDSRTPGFAQLGQVWLPLHHVFIILFVGNDFLWKTGLAGAIPAMVAYVIGNIFLYKLVKEITSNRQIAFVCSLGYITNPNILYLQSTPLSDVFCVCIFSITFYFFFLWARDGNIKYLIVAGTTTFAATLIRYDGWAIAPCLFFLVLFISFLHKDSFKKIGATGIVYILPAFSGIVLWMVWCKIIVGSFLIFQNGPYSSQAMQMELLQHGILPTYHNLLKDIQVYIIDGYNNSGKLYFITAPLALLLTFFRQRKKVEILSLIACFVPVLFYVLTLYSGQSVIYVTGGTPAGIQPDALFNTRYGIQTLIPCLILLGLFLHEFSVLLRSKTLKNVLLGTCIFLVLAQSYSIARTDIITHREGVQQCSFTNPYKKPENIFLQEHYDGGGILLDIHASGLDPRNFNVDLIQLIDESNNVLYHSALRSPYAYVHWIAFDPQNIAHDGVALYMAQHHNRPLEKYHLVLKSSTGLYLYLLNSVHTYPNRPLPASWSQAKNYCNQL